jgi:hypothetical protein
MPPSAGTAAVAVAAGALSLALGVAPVLVDGRAGKPELLGDLVATKASGGELLDLVRPFSAALPVEHFGRYPLAARPARPRL